METVTRTAGVIASWEGGAGGPQEKCQEWGTGAWFRSVLPQAFPDMRSGVCCHSC